jgi:NADPH-dependent 2,4-dienoyl-CoA reductase/sulfur reductase-like enzyme
MSVKSIYTFLNVDHPIDCAVVGSGLIALLTALELVRSGHFVTVYSDRFPKYGEKDVSMKMASQVD